MPAIEALKGKHITMTITHWIGLTCLLPFSVSAGEWDAVSYHFTPGEENRVLGPNEAYTSVRPDSGEWTANFGVSNHFANLKGEQIRVYFFHLHREAAYTEVADNIDHYMGLFTPWLEGQVRPKDAYFAVRTVIQVLDQSAYKGRIDDAVESVVPSFRARERGTSSFSGALTTISR